MNSIINYSFAQLNVFAGRDAIGRAPPAMVLTLADIRANDPYEPGIGMSSTSELGCHA